MCPVEPQDSLDIMKPDAQNWAHHTGSPVSWEEGQGNFSKYRKGAIALRGWNIPGIISVHYQWAIVTIILCSNSFHAHLFLLCVLELADLDGIWLAGFTSSSGFTCAWFLMKSRAQPWPCGSVGWSVVPYTKRLRVFFPRAGHIPRFPVQTQFCGFFGGESILEGCMLRGRDNGGNNQSIFLSYIDVFLYLFLPPSSRWIIKTYPGV